MLEQNRNTLSTFDIACGKSKIKEDQLVSFQVVLDLSQPDMCSVTLRNESNNFSNGTQLGGTIDLKTSDGKQIFAGEIVGLDPVYQAGGNNTVIVRGFSLLHRLSRTPRSQTFVQMTDAAIVERIVQNYRLTAQCGELAGNMHHKHVFQHNQTDLEFLRLRAARLGYEVWLGDNNTLHCASMRPELMKTPRSYCATAIPSHLREKKRSSSSDSHHACHRRESSIGSRFTAGIL
ncbi:MAG: hypothetical protein MJE77_25365 [Proteobacteria bacterium]|nr:hypothetical protein [Pseudomonadota bacterium]